MLLRTVAAVAALVFASPTALWATLLTFEFTGFVVQDPMDPENEFPDINRGDAITGFFRYDSNSPELDNHSDPFVGTYLFEPPFVPFSFTVESTTFAADPDSPPGLTILNDVQDLDFGLSDQFSFFASTATPPAGFNGEPFELGMILITTDLGVLTSTMLPSRFDANDWQTRLVFFSALSSTTRELVDIVGAIESINLVADNRALQAGDADQDLKFDQTDLVKVQQSAKYLSGQSATWGEGDWNGAPGGAPGSPPAGDGVFSQLDIVAALSAGVYLTGPYAAVRPNGQPDDSQTSVGYDARTGELWVDAPGETQLTSINIDSAAGIFTGDPADNLGGSFDNDTDGNLFKATFGSSFGSLSFGRVAPPDLDQDFLVEDLTVIGSLAGGGALGDVDLIYLPVPEPATAGLLVLGLVALAGWRVGAWQVANGELTNRA